MKSELIMVTPVVCGGVVIAAKIIRPMLVFRIGISSAGAVLGRFSEHIVRNASCYRKGN
jgi:hypothetical protein